MSPDSRRRELGFTSSCKLQHMDGVCFSTSYCAVCMSEEGHSLGGGGYRNNGGMRGIAVPCRKVIEQHV